MRDTLTDHREFITGRGIVIAQLYGDRTEPTGPVTITAVTSRWNGVGGRWADITVRDAAGQLHDLDTRDALILSADYSRSVWCPECRTDVEVADQFTTGWYERDGEHETTVTRLVCGHGLQQGDRIIGAAPGAPYAGPRTAVAASSSSRDRAAAQARLAAGRFDPWAEL